ncbi:PilZ domain-containing protein [Oryzomonas japonica]|uniref:PilZ domain-containing protein n=1 Tax=Oryzomonas japonica TaxID=2603858 RepID=A0A7J4ZMU3_9BACT|nr:PilZ domain-containing protein [Oryzomonas japonica]KAB0664039.1 PilZ domain-containing protein [Oryzomonas japonica]
MQAERTERSDKRFAIKTQCVLNIGGAKYRCLIDNLSTTGASIVMDGPVQEGIKVGEIGSLKALLLTAVEYRCKVVRVEGVHLGVQFLDT